jgi:hypothetical protein
MALDKIASTPADIPGPLMTRKMSLVAVCVSSAVVSSRFRLSSVNGRTFSMAITA